MTLFKLTKTTFFNDAIQFVMYIINKHIDVDSEKVKAKYIRKAASDTKVN